jgi:hypothetical protein
MRSRVVDRSEGGDAVAVSATAFERTSLAKVSLPSGVLTLGLAPDLAEVESGDDTLTPATDVTLIGVTWTFEQTPQLQHLRRDLERLGSSGAARADPADR